MKRLPATILCTAFLASLACAAKPWDGTYTAFSGRYLIYSGDLGEETPPTPLERRAAFVLQGELAKNLFDSLGPDQAHACGTSPGLRVRERGDLDCTYDKDDRVSPYVCHIGINLRTGKSMRGSIC